MSAANAVTEAMVEAGAKASFEHARKGDISVALWENQSESVRSWARAGARKILSAALAASPTAQPDGEPRNDDIDAAYRRGVMTERSQWVKRFAAESEVVACVLAIIETARKPMPPEASDPNWLYVTAYNEALDTVHASLTPLPRATRSLAGERTNA